jgi:hypothetical protein
MWIFAQSASRGAALPCVRNSARDEAIHFDAIDPA